MGGEERDAKPSLEGGETGRKGKIRVGPKASQKTRERAKIRVGQEKVRREVEPSLQRWGDGKGSEDPIRAGSEQPEDKTRVSRRGQHPPEVTAGDGGEQQRTDR